MKVFFSMAIGLTLALAVSAQTADDYIEVTREVFNTEKKAVVAEAMMLTEEQSAPFWELYNEYQAQLYTVHTKRVNLIKDYAKNYDMLSDEKADELMTNSFAYQQELLSLQKSYYKKFKKSMGPGVAARYLQVENKIESLVDCELAAEVPLAQPR